MADDTPDTPIPEAPPGYHAAIGRRGGGRSSPAKKEHLVRLGVKRRRFSPEAEAALLAEYDRGKTSYQKLAARYECSRATIIKTIRRARKAAQTSPE